MQYVVCVEFLARSKRPIVITQASSGRVFSHHISGKNERIQTNLGRKKLHQQGNPQENLGAYSERGALGGFDFFGCLYVASPFDPIRMEKTGRITWSYC